MQKHGSFRSRNTDEKWLHGKVLYCVVLSADNQGGHGDLVQFFDQ